MSLPLLLLRVSQDPSIGNYSDLAAQLNYTEVDPNSVVDRINELTELKSIIEQTIEQYNEITLTKLQSGVPVAGFKLKAGRKTRKVTNEDSLVAALSELGFSRDSLYVSKLAGLPAIEKMLKKEGYDPTHIDEYVDVQTGKPSVVIE